MARELSTHGEFLLCYSDGVYWSIPSRGSESLFKYFRLNTTQSLSYSSTSTRHSTEEPSFRRHILGGI